MRKLIVGVALLALLTSGCSGMRCAGKCLFTGAWPYTVVLTGMCIAHPIDCAQMECQ